MSSSEPKLNAKQEVAATALARGVSVEAAADEAGVNVRTVVRWRTDNDFTQAIADIRRDIHSQAIGQIVDSLTVATAALKEIAADPSAPASSRVSAAKCLLDSAYRAIEGAELERRLIEVEAAVAVAARKRERPCSQTAQFWAPIK
jgi:hypothetical protein